VDFKKQATKFRNFVKYCIIFDRQRRWKEWDSYCIFWGCSSYEICWQSANQYQLIVGTWVVDSTVTTYGRRAFSIAGPTVWNSLPDELGDPACDSDSF